MGESFNYVEVYQVKPGEIVELIINFLEARGIDAEVVRDRVVPKLSATRIMVPKTHIEEAKELMHQWEIGGFENTEYPESSLYPNKNELGETEDLGGYFT